MLQFVFFWKLACGEDLRPCGHKRVYEADLSLMPTPIMCKIAEKTINNQINNMNAFELRDLHYVSCANSDLFEMENIGSIGVGAYWEELPVYGMMTENASSNSRHFQRFDSLFQK